MARSLKPTEDAAGRRFSAPGLVPLLDHSRACSLVKRNEDETQRHSGHREWPNFQSMWVMGYDTTKKAFRYVLFGSNGRIDENIGQ